MDTLDNENKDINNSENNANQDNSDSWDSKDTGDKWLASDDSSTNGRDEEDAKSKKDNSWSDEKSDTNKEKFKEDSSIPANWKWSQEDWDNFKTDQDTKFQKQSSSYQQSITQFHEKLLKAETKTVEANPQRLIQLAESDDDKDVKLARQIAKNVFESSLSEAIAWIHKQQKEAWDEENDEDKEKRIRREIRKDESLKLTKETFISKNSIIDEKSDKFDEEIKKSFDWYISKLKRADEIITSEELNKILKDAYLLATKDLQEKEKEKDIKKSVNKVATAWNWWSNSKSWKWEEKSIFDWIDKSD